MERKNSTWDNIFNPLYFPLVAAIPLGVLLLVKSVKQPLHIIEMVTLVLTILFLIFSGVIRAKEKSKSAKLFGSLYIVSGIIFAVLGFFF